MKNSKVKIRDLIKVYLFRYLLFVLTGTIFYFVITGNLTSFIKTNKKKDYQLMYSFESRLIKIKESEIKGIRLENIIIGNTGNKPQDSIIVEVREAKEPISWNYSNRDIFPVTGKRSKPLVTQNKSANTIFYKVTNLPDNMLIEINWSILEQNKRSEITINSQGELVKGNPSTSLLAKAYYKIITLFI